MKLKTKNPGVSFAIGIIISTILLSVGLTVFESVSRVAEQGYDLEAKNQLFYQGETGFEAALYHHNKLGGKGIDFGAVGSNNSQIIDLGNGNMVEWTILGREKTDQGSGKRVLTGILQESQSIEIPFYYKEKTNPTDSNDDIKQIDKNFKLDFSRFEFDANGNEIDTNGNFVNSSNENTAIGIIPDIGATITEFNFPDNDKLSNGNPDPAFRNNVLISWAVTRKDSNGIIQTFVPRSDDANGTLCTNSLGTPNPQVDSSFFCEVLLNNPSNIDISIDSNRPIIGYILPGQTPETLDKFWNESNITDRKISFRPLALFYNDNASSEKIKGLPWKLTVDDEIPTPTFTIKTSSSFQNGKFTKSETVTLDEKIAISAFDSFNAE